MIKFCYKCKQSKSIDFFHKNKKKKDGFSDDCKSCKNALYKLYYLKNSEKIKQSVKRYRDTNLEKTKESKKNSLLKNKEYYKNIKLNWYKNNLGKAKSYSKKYKVLKIQSIPKWVDEEKIACLYSVAAMLNKYGNEKYHVDHIIPLRGKKVSGLHVENNLQYLPIKDNMKKHNTYHID